MAVACARWRDTSDVLRIERRRNGRAEVLHLEGTITGAWVGELRTSCERAAARDHARLVLDLGGVHFVDREGAVLLRGLAAAGTELTNLSPFVLDQLNDPEL